MELADGMFFIMLFINNIKIDNQEFILLIPYILKYE